MTPSTWSQSNPRQMAEYILESGITLWPDESRLVDRAREDGHVWSVYSLHELNVLCFEARGWKRRSSAVSKLLLENAELRRHAEGFQQQRDTALAEIAVAAARVDALLDEQVAIEQRIVDAGIESPDALTPAGTDVPNRILGMVEDLVAELEEAKNTIKWLRIKNACLLDNADREHGYAIARLTADLNGTKHALRIYEETASTLGVQVDHLERRLATAWRELELTRKAGGRRKGALRRLEGAYKAIVRLYLEKCRECGTALRERDEARAERDARPDITPEDAARVHLRRAIPMGNAEEHTENCRAALRVGNALRAHAERAGKGVPT